VNTEVPSTLAQLPQNQVNLAFGLPVRSEKNGLSKLRQRISFPVQFLFRKNVLKTLIVDSKVNGRASVRTKTTASRFKICLAFEKIEEIIFYVSVPMLKLPFTLVTITFGVRVRVPENPAILQLNQPKIGPRECVIVVSPSF